MGFDTSTLKNPEEDNKDTFVILFFSHIDLLSLIRLSNHVDRSRETGFVSPPFLIGKIGFLHQSIPELPGGLLLKSVHT